MLKIHHIGLIVRNIEKSIIEYKELGLNIEKDCLDDIQNNRIVFLYDSIGYRIELIEPINNQSSVWNCSPGYHHICFMINNTEQMQTIFKRKCIGKIFKGPICAPALDGKMIYFACLYGGEIVEFLIDSE